MAQEIEESKNKMNPVTIEVLRIENENDASRIE
jgi:hypothetical protein